MKILIKLIACFLVVFLASCSPQRRLQRLLEKHPELIEQTDKPVVVTVRDTVYIDSTQADTTFTQDYLDKVRGWADSTRAEQVTIATATNERGAATLLYYPTKSEYNLQLETFRDTIYRILTDTIYVPEVTYKVKQTSLKETIYSGILVLLLGLFMALVICIIANKFIDKL